MDVTLLYFDDCPNWRITADLLDRLAEERSEVRVRRRQVTTADDAVRLGFRGSPSVLVDGVDAFADADGDAPIGLSCRLYHTPAGMAGSPTLDQLRTALSERANQ